MQIHGTTQIYGILGNPVSHSLSPVMHNAAFQHLQMDARYVAFPVKPSHISNALDGIRALNIKGVNVTVPHKEAVLPYLDQVDDLAKTIGAVNTIRNDEGVLTGTNTDGTGLLKSISKWSWNDSKQTVAIVGAGGSARSIIAALAHASVPKVHILNRTVAKAETLAAEFQKRFPQTLFVATSLEKYPQESTSLLIQTSTVGMDGESQPVDLSGFKDLKYVVDIIYKKTRTPILEQAKSLGLQYQNGLGMLLYQGVEAFEFWTHKEPPVAVMQQALLNLESGG